MELRERLMQAISKNIPLANDISEAVIADLAGDMFALGARWGL